MHTRTRMHTPQARAATEGVGKELPYFISAYAHLNDNSPLPLWPSATNDPPASGGGEHGAGGGGRHGLILDEQTRVCRHVHARMHAHG